MAVTTTRSYSPPGRRAIASGSMRSAASIRRNCPDVLATCAASAWTQSIGRVVLHGFIAFTPQQQRLVGALRAARASTSARYPVVPRGASAGHRTACPTSSDELTQALGFARARLRPTRTRASRSSWRISTSGAAKRSRWPKKSSVPSGCLSLVPDAAASLRRVARRAARVGPGHRVRARSHRAFNRRRRGGGGLECGSSAIPARCRGAVGHAEARSNDAGGRRAGAK